MSSTTISARTGITRPASRNPTITDRYENEWGDPINFDGPHSEPVREFFLANAGYWIDEYHLDGLRLDATQQIFDASDDNIMAAIVRRVQEAAGDRKTFVVGENEPGHAILVRPPERGGYGLDALWNDDFHHSAMVALTGRHEAYYTDYRGAPAEFVAAAKYGCLYQGQHYVWQKQRRGTPALDLPAETRIVFLQNHDQIANSAPGLRVHAADQPRPLARDDRVLPADAGDSDAVSGPGIRRLDPVPVFRRPSRRSGRGRAQGPRRVPRAVPEHRRPGNADAPGRPGRPRRHSAASSSISASASGTRRPTRCIATCSRCAATIRCSGGGRRGSMAR